MTVVLSILFAAIVGGVIFVLLDNWQRRDATPAAADPPASPIWTPEARTEPLPPRPIWTPPTAQTEPLPPRPRRAWDADDRDDDDRPPNLWSGWAGR